MAISAGMICFHCEKKPAKKDSHFCGKKCEAAWMSTHDGPVDCLGVHYSGGCSSESDTVRWAKEDGWIGIEPDSEGISNNYTGICPACQSAW